MEDQVSALNIAEITKSSYKCLLIWVRWRNPADAEHSVLRFTAARRSHQAHGDGCKEISAVHWLYRGDAPNARAQGHATASEAPLLRVPCSALLGPISQILRRARTDRSPCCYRMTSSACTKMDSGTLMLSASAAFRFTTILNLVGCSIGRSPGFAPFRILSTYVAVRLNVSIQSTE